ncbi:MAG: hypothetical protein IJU45_08860 [Clostridia bacterium]|nr:hypothetical protein [Clostridia bacterium]
MKRFAALLLIIIFTTCLCACRAEKGGGSEGSVTSAHTATRPYEDARLKSAANDIADGLFTGSMSDFTDEEKSLIQSYLSERNYKVEFNKDGTAVLTRSGNTWLVSTEWPQNSYTEDVPEQTLGTATMSIESKEHKEAPEFIINIKSSGDSNAFEKYQKTLAEAGFNSVGGNYYEGDEVYVGVKDSKTKIRIEQSGKGYVMRITKILNSETD